MEILTKEEIDLIKNATSENEQNEACDKIKKNHGGQYPSDWHQVVILGKLLVDTTITITSR